MRTAEGTTGRLIQLCVGYFTFYVLTGVAVKFFLGSAQQGFPGMKSVEYLVYSTLGSAPLVLGIVLALRWYRLRSLRRVQIGGFRFPSEILYIVPSGVCTAVVIPTTTLMYTLPISVMVAMVIMRGSVIVISRAVDAIQARQGLLDRQVYPEENTAVLFAIAAVAVNTLGAREGGFEFLRSAPAMGILASYVGAYAIRIYIMNYYKNTHARKRLQDNRAFFAVEQIAASLTLLAGGILVFQAPALFGAQGGVIGLYRGAFLAPHPQWGWAILSGLPFGAVAFFSVFLFMFHGRTATFAGLVNRLTSLIAGTTATLAYHFAFGGRLPSRKDWIALALIFVAIAFLARAERKRVAELRARHELEEAPAPGALPGRS